MSITPKEQFEDAIAENARLRRELDAAQAESAEARGNVEKALPELGEEVRKRLASEAKCAEMRSCIAWLNSHQQSPLETAWNDHVQHALSSDCSKDYVPKTELDKAKDENQHIREWYSSRMERLSQFIREEIHEPEKTRYFSIIANGAADTLESNSYECELVKRNHEIERLEKVVKQLVLAAQLALDWFETGPADFQRAAEIVAPELNKAITSAKDAQ